MGLPWVGGVQQFGAYGTGLCRMVATSALELRGNVALVVVGGGELVSGELEFELDGSGGSGEILGYLANVHY